VTRRLSPGASGYLGLLALVPALGCESQVNDDYTGEPLFSLQGSVILSKEQANSNLEPRLSFHDGSDSENYDLILIGGELTGEFPAKFRFDVTQPPPDTTLAGPMPQLGLITQYAYGQLVMAPADQLELVEIHLSHERLEGECTEDGATCTHLERICAEDGRCRERVVECTQRACELTEQWGDSTVGVETSSRSRSYCDQGICYELESACDADGKCRTDVYRCEFAEHETSGEFAAPLATACSVQSESGDRSLSALDQMQSTARDYALFYVTGDNPASNFGPLERGYNLITDLGSIDAELDAEKCRLAFIASAVDEYNSEHGTTLSPLGLDQEVFWTQNASFQACPANRVIEHPLEEELTIELGAPAAF